MNFHIFSLPYNFSLLWSSLLCTIAHSLFFPSILSSISFLLSGTFQQIFLIELRLCELNPGDFLIPQNDNPKKRKMVGIPIRKKQEKRKECNLKIVHLKGENFICCMPSCTGSHSLIHRRYYKIRLHKFQIEFIETTNFSDIHCRLPCLRFCHQCHKTNNTVLGTRHK